MSDRNRAARWAVALATAGVLAVAGCSSSSSSTGTSPQPSAAADHTETFDHVSAKANAILQRSLALMRGVASNTYQGHQLTVTFRSTAERIDQTNVENVVHQAQQQASAKPTPTTGTKRQHKQG